MLLVRSLKGAAKARKVGSRGHRVSDADHRVFEQTQVPGSDLYLGSIASLALMCTSYLPQDQLEGLVVDSVPANLHALFEHLLSHASYDVRLASLRFVRSRHGHAAPLEVT